MPFHPLGREAESAGRPVTPPHPGACPVSSTQGQQGLYRKQTQTPLLKVPWQHSGLELAWSGKARLDPQVLTLYSRSHIAECHSDDLTSRSPASKDQTSSLVSTCHTFKRPLMSPVATRVESWLKPAQVTESLWPARESRQKSGVNLTTPHNRGSNSLPLQQSKPPGHLRGDRAGLPLNHAWPSLCPSRSVHSTPLPKIPAPPFCLTILTPGRLSQLSVRCLVSAQVTVSQLCGFKLRV